VDATTSRYVEFTSQGKYAALGLPRSGSDFFADARENVQQVVCEEDREAFLRTFDRDQLLRELEVQHLCTLTYRLMIDGVPTFYNVRAMCTSTREGKNIVVGVSNVDAIVRQSMSCQQTRASEVTYSQLANVLAQDYFKIYFVDARTNEYQQYKSKGSNQELSLEKNGQDFFEDIRKEMLRVVYGPDQEKALQVWHRDYILSELEQSDCFSTSCRLMLDGVPVYVSLKAIRASEENPDHIVVGISSIDAQMKRNDAFAQAQEDDLLDALTGVKNNRAYDQVELALNAQIAEGQVKNFAVVVCDVNDLKGVNEARGHVMGDQYIKDACAMVCQIFAHSPVFRIGGDTFVAILRSADYQQRFDLMGVLDQHIYVNQVSGKATMAVGIAEFRTGQDKTVLEVYERANERMHRNKKAYKSHK
jgi:diguanylate cyclase (GGDEF)-like protein